MVALPSSARLELALLRRYNDLAIRVTHEVPGGAAIRAMCSKGQVQRGLWRLAGESLNARPRDSAPRLYVDSLNAMIDQQTVRLSGLNNRVPNEVLWLELLGAAVALGLLALYPFRPWQRHDPDRGRRSDRQLHRACHLRSRPPDAGSDRDRSDTAPGREGHDEPASRGPGTPLNGSTAVSLGAAYPSPSRTRSASGPDWRLPNTRSLDELLCVRVCMSAIDSTLTSNIRQEPPLGDGSGNHSRDHDHCHQKRELSLVDDPGVEAVQRRDRAERQPGTHEQGRERRVTPIRTASERIDEGELGSHLRRQQDGE